MCKCYVRILLRNESITLSKLYLEADILSHLTRGYVDPPSTRIVNKTTQREVVMIARR